MNFRILIKTKLTKESDFPQRLRISTDNIGQWISYENLLKEGRVKFDKQGRLRYLHGAPVGDLILSGVNGNGKPVYENLVTSGLTLKAVKQLTLNGQNNLVMVTGHNMVLLQ